jgi:acyl-coenzyme A thioesterase PaaI-like protein
MSDPLQSLAARFEQAPYNARLGIRVESVERDRVRIRVPFKDEISNPGRALHGRVSNRAPIWKVARSI